MKNACARRCVVTFVVLRCVRAPKCSFADASARTLEASVSAAGAWEWTTFLRRSCAIECVMLSPLPADPCPEYGHYTPVKHVRTHSRVCLQRVMLDLVRTDLGELSSIVAAWPCASSSVLGVPRSVWPVGYGSHMVPFYSTL